MDPQFQELAAQITREVTQAVTRDVTKNVTEAVKKDVTEALKDHVTEVVSAAEGRLTEHAKSTLDAAERRLSEQAQINVENVRAETRLAAEGYSGVLESINRKLTGIEGQLAKQATHYDMVLANHNDRITTLEQKQS